MTGEELLQGEADDFSIFQTNSSPFLHHFSTLSVLVFSNLERMKILWMSDNPTMPTGYAQVTRAVCAGLADWGHQVSILGWYAFRHERGQNRRERWHKCTLYPLHLQRSFDDEVLLGYVRLLQPDVVVMLGEPWFPQFNHPLLTEYLRTAGIPRALYYAFDGDLGGGRLPADWIDILKTVDLPIAMSQYGAEVSQANGVSAVYIPLGVDTSVFRPPADKEQAKRALGYEGRFVILSDARNHPRKQVPRTVEIFHRFAEARSDVLLHLHCDPDDPAAHSLGYCYDLRSDIAERDLTPRVRITEGMSMSGGLSLAELVKLYQAADVHLLSSVGEGFGLPTLQAAACGVVPMAADYSASRELLSEHGEAVRVHHFCAGPFGVRRAFIDVDDAASKLDQLYRDREKLSAKVQMARRFALGYDWGGIVREWHKFLEGQVLPRSNYPWLRRGQPAGKKGQNHQRERDRLETMFSCIPKADVLSVLDCGGTGGATVSLLREQGLRACGFESSDWAVLEAKRRFPELASLDYELHVPVLRKDDITKLAGYADNSFDLVMAIDVLAHIPPEHLEEALSNLVRVSRRYVYVAVPIQEQEADTEGDQPQSKVPSRQVWERLFAQCGAALLWREHADVRQPSAPKQAWTVFPLQVHKTGKDAAASTAHPPVLSSSSRP